MGEALSNANPALLLAAACAYLAAHGIRAGRWRYLLAHLHDCGYWRPFHALTIGVTANNLLPVKAGVIARVHLLSRRTGLSHAAIGSSMVVEALFDGAVLLTLIVAALALAELDGTVRTAAFALAASMGLAAVLVALVLGGWLPRRPGRALLRRLPSRFQAALGNGGRHLIAGLEALRHPLQAGSVLGASLLCWTLMGVAYVLLGEALGMSLGIGSYLVLVAVAQFTLGAPPAGGNIGAFEVVVAQTLGAVGVGAGMAGAYAVALHAMIVVPVTVIGLALLWADGRGPQRLPRAVPSRLAVHPRLRLVGGGAPALVSSLRRRGARAA